jgi:hypothetical protein
LSGLLLTLKHGLRVLDLIAEAVEAVGDGGFAHPGQGSLSLSNPFRGLLHAKLDFVLLDFAQRLTEL